MVDRKCMGCEDEGDGVFMFKGTFFNEDTKKFEVEVYCNECVANIMTEEPGMVSDLEAI